MKVHSWLHQVIVLINKMKPGLNRITESPTGYKVEVCISRSGGYHCCFGCDLVDICT